ncbi:MAG: DUF4915 domain-containing protein [Candidatus Competibacteraceae bacterium]
MGMAADQKRKVGAGYQIWEFRNMPAVAARLDPPDQHDACYLPREIHVTGDIDIHEMAYLGATANLADQLPACPASTLDGRIA